MDRKNKIPPILRPIFGEATNTDFIPIHYFAEYALKVLQKGEKGQSPMSTLLPRGLCEAWKGLEMENIADRNDTAPCESSFVKFPERQNDVNVINRERKSTYHDVSFDNDILFEVMTRVIIIPLCRKLISDLLSEAVVSSKEEGEKRENVERPYHFYSSALVSLDLGNIVDSVIETLVERQESKMRRDRWLHHQSNNFHRFKRRSGNKNFAINNYNKFTHTRNVLSQGYTRAKPPSSSSSNFLTPSFCSGMGPGVQCAQPNSTTSFVRTSPLMKEMHKILGDAGIREMLLKCIVLVPTNCRSPSLGSGKMSKVEWKGRNYFQICGPPLTCGVTISTMIAMFKNIMETSTKTKHSERMKNDPHTHVTKVHKRKRDDIDDIEMNSVEGNNFGENEQESSEDVFNQQLPKKRRKKPKETKEKKIDSCNKKTLRGRRKRHRHNDAGISQPKRLTQTITKHKEDRNHTKKRRKITNICVNDNEEKWDPNTPIRRNNNFFYSESFVPKVGLPPSHPLNMNIKIKASEKKTGMSNDCKDGNKCVKYASALKLLDSMVGLFIYDKNNKKTNEEKTFSRKRRRKKKKRWMRLRKSGIEICMELKKRHDQCDYARLFEKYCPLPPAILVKEQQQPLQTSTSQSTTNDGTVTMSSQGSQELSSTTTGTTTLVSKLVHSYTPKTNVALYIESVLRHAFPSSFWGSKYNFDRVVCTMKKFVHLRRKETFCYKDIMFGLRVTDVRWLWGDDRDSKSDDNETKKIHKTSNNSLSNHQATTNLLLRVMKWLYFHYIFPLLRSLFYITESEFTSNDILFYRKPVWSKLRNLVMKSGPLKKQFRSIGLDEAMCRKIGVVVGDGGNDVGNYDNWRYRLFNDIGPSLLRLVPKENGVRPIAALSKRQFVQFKRNCDSSDGPNKVNGLVGTTTNLVAARSKSKSTSQWKTVLLNRTLPCNPRMSSTNAILRRSGIFDVLKYEHLQNPHNFGCGVPGFSDILSKMSTFQSDLLHIRQNQRQQETFDASGAENDFPPLYFASVDIHKCYDNMDQQYLFDLLQNKIISEDQYLIQNYSVLHPISSHATSAKNLEYQEPNILSQRNFRAKFSKRVSGIDGFEKFQSLVNDKLSWRHSNSIFVDGSNCKVVKKSQILEVLHEHIFNHVVIMNKCGGNDARCFAQKSGIPQGSVLSSMLCNYYYGDLEEELLDGVFSPLEHGGRQKYDSGERSRLKHAHFLLRVVDDFILITTDQEVSKRFLSNMYRGIPRLGVKINKAKTHISYDATIDVGNGCMETVTKNTLTQEHRKQAMTFFPWCGLLLDCVTCQVRIDYSRFIGPKSIQSLTVDTNCNRGSRLQFHMKNFIRPRCSLILFDLSVNLNLDMIWLNFHQAVLFCAVKTVNYIGVMSKVSGREGVVTMNPGFIHWCLEDVILYGYSLIQSRFHHAQKKNFDDHDVAVRHREFGMSKSDALWLGRSAFRAVFQLRLERYKDVLVLLDQKLGILPYKEKREKKGKIRSRNIHVLHQVSKLSLQGFDLKRFDIL